MFGKFYFGVVILEEFDLTIKICSVSYIIWPRDKWRRMAIDGRPVEI